MGTRVPPGLQGQWVYICGARCFEGVNPAWGGQAATLVADHQRVVPLGGVEPQQGVLLALAATALHGVDLLMNQPPAAGNRNWRTLMVRGQSARLPRWLLGRAGAWVAVTCDPRSQPA